MACPYIPRNHGPPDHLDLAWYHTGRDHSVGADPLPCEACAVCRLPHLSGSSRNRACTRYADLIAHLAAPFPAPHFCSALFVSIEVVAASALLTLPLQAEGPALRDLQKCASDARQRDARHHLRLIRSVSDDSTYMLAAGIISDPPSLAAAAAAGAQRDIRTFAVETYAIREARHRAIDHFQKARSQFRLKPEPLDADH